MSTHISTRNRPTMTNVGAKRATRRAARVQAIAKLPPPQQADEGRSARE